MRSQAKPPLPILPHDEHRAEHSLSVSLNKAKHSPTLCVSHPPPLSYPFPNSLIETFSPAAFEDNGALEFMGYIFQPPRLGFSWVQVSARCLCLWWITQSDPDQRGCFISMCADVPISQTHSRGLQPEIVINLMNSIHETEVLEIQTGRWFYLKQLNIYIFRIKMLKLTQKHCNITINDATL